MTVLVGITNGKNVYIGADRAASDESTVITMYRPKVHVTNKWIYAYAGSVGTGQLIEFVNFPTQDKKADVYKTIKLEIVKQLKQLIADHGDDGDDNGAEFLIGVNGRLFEFSSSDWGIVEVTETAGGSGNQIALGSLYTTYTLDMDIEDRIKYALEAAIEYSPTCQGPVDIMHI